MQKWKFWQKKTRKLSKNGNISEKYKFCHTIEILANLAKFSQLAEIWTKIEILTNNQNWPDYVFRAKDSNAHLAFQVRPGNNRKIYSVNSDLPFLRSWFFATNVFKMARLERTLGRSDHTKLHITNLDKELIP